jgi:hypothetical protein
MTNRSETGLVTEGEQVNLDIITQAAIIGARMREERMAQGTMLEELIAKVIEMQSTSQECQDSKQQSCLQTQHLQVGAVCTPRKVHNETQFVLDKDMKSLKNSKLPREMSSEARA